jgi:hypothetical protein
MHPAVISHRSGESEDDDRRHRRGDQRRSDQDRFAQPHRPVANTISSCASRRLGRMQSTAENALTEDTMPVADQNCSAPSRARTRLCISRQCHLLTTANAALHGLAEQGRWDHSGHGRRGVASGTALKDPRSVQSRSLSTCTARSVAIYVALHTDHCSGLARQIRSPAR